ncbi:MAG: hypothetical protein ACI9EW_000062 [Cellvibrionaceae bacterium]|jgi:hypothetical protein
MKRTSSKLGGIFLLIIGLMLVAPSGQVFGHNGGEPRLVDIEAGDFRLSVWSLPVPLVTGEQNFIVFVAESSIADENSFVRANTPVLDANIELVVQADEGGEPFVIKPDHERATNKLFYETYFILDDPGSYTGIVSVEADGKMGEAGFSFEVAQGTIEINWLRYSGFAVLAVAIAWFVWQIYLDKKQEVQ